MMSTSTGASPHKSDARPRHENSRLRKRVRKVAAVTILGASLLASPFAAPAAAADGLWIVNGCRMKGHNETISAGPGYASANTSSTNCNAVQVWVRYSVHGGSWQIAKNVDTDNYVAKAVVADFFDYSQHYVKADWYAGHMLRA